MQDRFKHRGYHKELKKFFEVEGIYPYSDDSTEGGEVFLKGFKNSFYFPEEVELIQCTGLKDKNGKLIYERDIVHKSGSKFNGEKVLSEIAWSETSAHFVYSDYIGIGGSHEFRNGTAAKMEVLGNIYENPELVRK